MGMYCIHKYVGIRFRLAGPAAEGPGRDQPPVWRPPPLPRPVAERAHRRTQYVIHTPNAPHTKAEEVGETENYILAAVGSLFFCLSRVKFFAATGAGATRATLGEEFL